MYFSLRLGIWGTGNLSRSAWYHYHQLGSIHPHQDNIEPQWCGEKALIQVLDIVSLQLRQVSATLNLHQHKWIGFDEVYTYSLLAASTLLMFSLIISIITSPQSPPQVVQTYLQPCRWSRGSWPHLNKVVFATRLLFDDAACYHSQKSSQPGDSSRSHPPPSSPAQDYNFVEVAILCSFISYTIQFYW